MKDLSIQSPKFLEGTRKPTGLDTMAKRIVRQRLKSITAGQIVVTENGRHETFGQLTPEFPLTAHLSIHDPAFYSEIAFGGVIGSGEAYIHGYWSCDELTTLVRILLRNRDVLSDMNSGAARLTRPLQRLFHRFKRNKRDGSRRNISAHYDLGNDFYSLWLDETMMYSAAVFERPDMSLTEASTAKLDRICRKLRLSPDDHVVEIGTGWGGFAIHAAGRYGCRVTTTTISCEQHDYARDAIAAAGLEDRIDLLFEDYRDLDGQFDKLVSIEMIEAVGWQFHNAFFKKCSSLLKKHGEMMLQAITMADQYYEDYKNSVDFIRRYIFPGGCLTSLTAMSATLTNATDMRSVHVEDIGPHYAKTLEIWHKRFEAVLDDVCALGYSDEFIRMWKFYLSYCEGAFRERTIGNVQMHIVKPGARPDVVGF